MIYQIKDWETYFEVAQSRQATIHNWVAMPNHHDGDSYTELVEEHKNGTAHFGVWCAIVQACSQQRMPRDGWLTKDGTKTGKPHTAKNLSRKTRLPEKTILEALPRLVDIGWIVRFHDETNSGLTVDSQPGNTPLLQQTDSTNKQTEQSFERFWLIWRKKIDKQDVVAWFKKNEPDGDLMTVILSAVESWNASEQWADPQYIPSPKRFLGKKKWEDEIPRAGGLTHDQLSEKVSREGVDMLNYTRGEDGLWRKK